MADQKITPDDVNLGDPETSGYKPINTGPWDQTPLDLPVFNWLHWRRMLMDPTIRLGLAMRAAPLCGAEIAYQDPSDEKKWIPGVRAENSVIADYVHRQMLHIWHNELPAILRSQATGWNACEVTGRECNGLIDIDRFFPRKAEDVLVRVVSGEPIGVKFLRIQDAEGGTVSLDFPNCLWNPFNPDEGQYYSLPVTFGAYSPWWSKWMKGGALKSLDLFMHKCAFGGARLRYPEGQMRIANAGNVPNSQTAREMIEVYESGGVVSMSSKRDITSKEYEWVWEDAKVTDFPEAVFEYPKMLDCWMLRGLEIPDDVLLAEATGAWAGKIVPMTAFYTGLDLWLRRIIQNLKRQLIDKYVIMNFGRLYWYEITTKPLALQAMEQQGANKADPGPATQYGQQQADPAMRDGREPVQMSLERMVGRGVMDAARVVRMANGVTRKKTKRMSLDFPTAKFSSTQFNLPPDLLSVFFGMAARIAPDDLAEDGIETQPHVTIKYGLHTNSADEVRRSLGVAEPVAISFGETSVFSSDSHDVVKVEIESKGLRELNAAVSELPHTDTYPDYQPHLTISYVKPGAGQRYADSLKDLKGKVAVFDRFIFSDQNRQHTSIPLLGKPKRFSL